MNDVSGIRVLVAEDNGVSRDMMVQILVTKGYDVLVASDGSEAIKITSAKEVHLALVDVNMEPLSGFDYVKHLKSNQINIPVIIITSDESSDILMKASELGVPRVIQKPIEPARLLQTIDQVVKRYDISSEMVVQTYDGAGIDDPEVLMGKAIALARKNAESGRGGPYGAILVSDEGKILGEGVNGASSRVDPTAHAEVMAIRQAAEKLGQDDLSECTLYLSSEPTMIGKALIRSVGIETVYYALSHKDIQNMRTKRDSGPPKELPDTEYIKIGNSEAIYELSDFHTAKD